MATLKLMYGLNANQMYDVHKAITLHEAECAIEDRVADAEDIGTDMSKFSMKKALECFYRMYYYKDVDFDGAVEEAFEFGKEG